MATKYYIKGLGFIEDNEANRKLLISLGRIKEEKQEVVKPKKKKKNDTADTGYTQPDSGNTERTKE